MNIEFSDVTTDTLETKSPFAISADDYHQFDFYQELFSKLLNKKVKFHECGCSGEYWAVFWVGKKPTSFIKRITKEVESEY